MLVWMSEIRFTKQNVQNDEAKLFEGLLKLYYWITLFICSLR